MPKNISSLYRSMLMNFGLWLGLWVPLLLISSVSIFSAYQINLSEVSVQDLILPLLLNMITATLIAAVFFPLFLRNRFAPYISALVVTFIATSTLESKFGGILSTLSALLPFSIPNHIFIVIYLITMVWVIYRLVKWLEAQIIKRKILSPREFIGAATVVVIGLFLSEFIPAATDLIQAWPQYFYTPPALAAAHPTAAEAAAKPDIYYILLEDYTNQDVLENQMNYDNSGFMNFLSGNGFYNVPDAYTSYPYTVNSVAATFNAGYLSDQVNAFSAAKNQTLIPYFSTIRESPVIQQLKSMGYTYDLLGDWYETSNYSPLADANYTNNRQVEIFNHVYGLNEFGNNEIQQSVLWSFLNKGINFGSLHLFDYIGESDIDSIMSQLSELKTLAAQPAGGRFIYSEILLPHNYFYFNSDGSLESDPGPNNNDKPVKEKYTDNVQYINSQIEPVISEIMQNSGGKADIILLSDEGPQPGQMNQGYDSIDLHEPTSDMTTWSQADLQMKFGVLASYYIPNASAANLAQGANSVNVFRLLLNTDFNDSLPYLPECYYGFPEGENGSFVYQNINQQLTGQSNASCPQNSNFINPGATNLLKVDNGSSDSGDGD